MKATTLLLIMAITAGGVFAYDRYKAARTSPEPQVDEAAAHAPPPAAQFERPWGQPPEASAPVARASTSYQCDGRTHCSQMRSCDEARHFLQHCPNTKMDGDRDGIPCENQWCN